LKVVMINDCAYVGETLLKYFPSDIEVTHLKRSRGLWNKTFGIAWRILRTKGDIFHVHYMLQDCYLALTFGKNPVIGHAHGSDLRTSLKHPLWKRIVKYNLKNCSKVIVSTPDILKIAKQFREDAVYLPNPVDTEFFYPKPPRNAKGKKHVLIASELNWRLKGTDLAIEALSKWKEEIIVSAIGYGKDVAKTVAFASYLGLHLNILPKVPPERLTRYYWDADIVIDQFLLVALGLLSLEAIACGRPVIAYVSSEYDVYRDFPLKDVTSVDKIIDAFKTSPYELWSGEYEYLSKYHKPEEVIKKVFAIYNGLE